MEIDRNMKKVLKVLGIVLLVLVLGLIFWVHSNLKDRHPGYLADLKIHGKPSALSVGFSAVAITPEVPDKWVDKNNDQSFHPKDGDTFTDGNGNGIFDPVWIAGFSNDKPAAGIHDDTWARTMVFDDGQTRLSLTVLDVIGFMNDDIIDIRNSIPKEAGITYAVVSSTHTHEGPDLLGLWGETPFRSGIDPKYMQFVKDQVIKSILNAVKNKRPARLSISEDLTGAIPLVKDTRLPEVFDSGMRIIKAIDKENGTTLGSLVAWGDHPETLWSDNLLVTSDFPHYVREGIEKGVFNKDSLMKGGIGATTIYINGAVGGLMTTHPSLTVKDPFTGQEFKEPTFEKAEAQGKQLAILALNAMDKPIEVIDTAAISLLVKTILLPIQNPMFKMATALGVLNRGTTGWMKVRTELAVFNIGPISFATLPGEVYPEILNGGVEAPDGNDFNIQPVEIPAVRDLMQGKYKFVFGLTNDEIGYIVPKSQWDEKAPYTYNRKDSPYGEENSMGTETAPILHRNLKEMLTELNQMK